MTQKITFGLIAAIALATGAHAEGQRTVYTHENAFPELHKAELNVDLMSIESGDRNEAFADGDRNSVVTAPKLRYTLLPELVGSVKAPVVFEDPDNGGSEVGLGNLELGLELKAFEDIFNYPYVIPHVELGLETAGSNLQTIRDENFARVGVSVGTVTKDTFTWVGDVSYQMFSESENIFIFSASLIADISKDFSVIGEIQLTDEEVGSKKDHPVNFLGGFSYDWSPAFRTCFYAGAGLDSSDDVVAMVRATYSW